MRNGQNKRMRGRNRKGQNPLTRVYESNGPDVKIRGTPNHVAEKYVQLARDAQASGDPVAAENYFQHAEHYFRLIAAAQEQFRQSNPYFRPDGDQRGESFDAGEDDSGDQPMTGDMPYGGREQPSYPPREAQPYQPQPYQPREQPYGGRPQPQVPQQGRPEGGDPGLPAFITGGGQPQPPYQDQRHSPNGFDGQPDRFPLHRRRRRRHGGPRGDMPGQYGGGGGGGSEEAAPPPSPGEPSQD
jgi:hypothetical protein